MKSGAVWIAAGLLFFCGGLFNQRVVAQDFPYMVPQAPEFDRRGNVVEPRAGDASSPEPRSESPYSWDNYNSRTDLVEPRSPRASAGRRSPRSHDSQGQTEVDYRTVRPYAPEAQTSPPAPPQPPQVQRHAPPPARGPTVASSPAYPSGQIQSRPDCSQYPMMIARARSEPEMQMTARQYLTCLLKNGWGMDQARQHVINTIESTYRLAR